MEGVLVSAKKEGATVTTTVVTNDKGEFSFPAGRLEPGKYTITTRAVGFTLVGPKTVDVGAASATAEIKLAKARNIVPQLSNGEWLMSIPGSDQFKASFLRATTPTTVGTGSSSTDRRSMALRRSPTRMASRLTVAPSRSRTITINRPYTR